MPSSQASQAGRRDAYTTMNIVLIGYRGTGKSAVARCLGLRQGCPWIDADVEVERRAGRSIAAIFADSGELAFRDLESQVLAELVGRDRFVLAAGGGAVLREENRRMLRSRGTVVWLQASAATIARRIAADHSTAGRRPNLTAAGGESEIVQLLAQRAPLYRECADLEVDTEGKSPAEVADEIVERVNLRPESELA